MGSDYAQWIAVVAAMTVTLSVVVVLWLCGQCCRQIEMRRVVNVEKQTLFNFLCDPHNLKIIHPYTTEIWVMKECVSEGKTMLKWFTWEEKVPFTAESDVSMVCDPVTSSIIINVTPAGGMFEVQLKWFCVEVKTRTKSSNLSDDSLHGKDASPAQQTPHSVSDASRDNGMATTKTTTTTTKRTHRKDDDKKAMKPTRTYSTLFRNDILVTGRRAIVLPVAIPLIRFIQLKLMNRLEQHFTTKQE